MKTNTATYIGKTFGTWKVLTHTAKRAKGGGVFWNAECIVCHTKLERPALQIRSKPPQCPVCKGTKTKTLAQPQLAVLSHGRVHIVLNTSFRLWVSSLPATVLNTLVTEPATVYVGDSEKGLDLLPNPWDGVELTRDTITQEIQQMADKIKLLSATSPSKHLQFLPQTVPNPPPSLPHLIIKEEDKVFFTGEETDRALPAYIVHWASTTPHVEDLEYTYLTANEGHLYVVFSRKSEGFHTLNAPNDPKGSAKSGVDDFGF